MRKLTASTAALSLSAFASGKNADKPADGATGNPGPAPGTTGDTAKPKADRIEPIITAVTAAVPLPEIRSKRGSATKYPFASLTAVGTSFGVKNKTAAQLRAVVNNASRKSETPKKDANGNVLFKMQDVKDANGVVVGQTPTTTPLTERTMEFLVIDVDPANDPDGATARVFRTK